MAIGLRVGFGCVALALVCWAALWIVDLGPDRWRERITFVVQTPAGLRSASGVHQFTLHPLTTKEKLLGIQGIEAGSFIGGEAIPLEVGPGRWVFRLALESESGAVFAPMYKTGRDPERSGRTLNRTIGQPPVEISPISLQESLFVTFRDVEEPDSAVWFMGKDFEEVLGPGHLLLSTTVEITNDPMTVGRLEGILDWWFTSFFTADKRRSLVAQPGGEGESRRFDVYAFWPKVYLDTLSPYGQSELFAPPPHLR